MANSRKSYCLRKKKWVGSSNQRVIDVQQSLKLRKGVILWDSEKVWNEEEKNTMLKKCMRYLGVNKFQKFYFSNRNHKDVYFFDTDMLVKELPDGTRERSGISFNFMMYESKEFIVKTDEYAGVV